MPLSSRRASGANPRWRSIGLYGTHAEAEAIKQQLGEWQTLRLQLSETKTLVTHAVTERARFLGYEVSIGLDDQRRNTQREPSINWQPTLLVPRDRIETKRQTYLRNGKPIHRKELTTNSDYSIVAGYQAEYRGVVNYYRMATNLRDLTKLKWPMEASLTKPLPANSRQRCRGCTGATRSPSILHTDDARSSGW